MKASIFYFNEQSFLKEPQRFFTDAEETRKMLNENGLENFVRVDSHEDISAKSKQQYAEKLFAIYNDGTAEGNPLATEDGQKKIRCLGAGHTSMSINDFVVIDGDVLIVDSFGFKNIGDLGEVLKN